MKKPRTPTLRRPLPTLPAPWSWEGPDANGDIDLRRDSRLVATMLLESGGAAEQRSVLLEVLRYFQLPRKTAPGGFRAFVRAVIKAPPRDWTNDEWNSLISACRSGRSRRRTMKAERERLRNLRPGKPAPRLTRNRRSESP